MKSAPLRRVALPGNCRHHTLMTWLGIKAGMNALALLAVVQAAGAQDIASRPTNPGLTAGYEFSAELGGFQIMALAGLGTRTDPVRIDKAVFAATPVTLVIRATKPINPFAHPTTHSTGTLHFDISIENRSGLPWIGAEFELQEMIGQASVYGDGLSFDQRRIGNYATQSDRFTESQQDFEPYDRILFHSGAVDSGQTVRFRFLVTDLTPAKVFYMRFDPRIPAS